MLPCRRTTSSPATGPPWAAAAGAATPASPSGRRVPASLPACTGAAAVSTVPPPHPCQLSCRPRGQRCSCPTRAAAPHSRACRESPPTAPSSSRPLCPPTYSRRSAAIPREAPAAPAPAAPVPAPSAPVYTNSSCPLDAALHCAMCSWSTPLPPRFLSADCLQPLPTHLDACCT